MSDVGEPDSSEAGDVPDAPAQHPSDGPDGHDSDGPTMETGSNPDVGDGGVDDGDATTVPEAGPIVPDVSFVKALAWQSPTIKVCWEHLGNDEEKQWVKDAALDSWAAVSAIRFTGWGDCGEEPTNLRLRFVPANQIGPALVGTAADNLPGGVTLRSDDIPGCTLTSRKACVSAYAVHRLGHALGFNHALNGQDDPAGCLPGGGVVATDEESVMSFCNPRGLLSASKLGAGDIQTIANAYGFEASSFVFHVIKYPWRQVATIDSQGQFSTGKTVVIGGLEEAADLMAVGHNGTILYYTDVDGGRMDVGTVSDAGDVAIVDSTTGIGTWKLITAVQNGYFLAYTPDRNGGELAVFRVNARGHYEGRVYVETKVSELWTHVAGTLTGELFFFAHATNPTVETDDGFGRIARVTPDGKVEIQEEWVMNLPRYDLLTAVSTNAVVLYRNAKKDPGRGLGRVIELSPKGVRRTIVDEMEPAPAYFKTIVGARNGALFLFNDVRGALDSLTGRIGLVDATGYREVAIRLSVFPDFSLMGAE